MALGETVAKGLTRLASLANKRFRNEYDGARQRRRLATWQPTQNTINTIIASSGHLLRARCRDALRNNAHATTAVDSFVANLIGTGIKPSSLLITRPVKIKEPVETPEPGKPPFAKRPRAQFPPEAEEETEPPIASPDPKQAALREAIMNLWLEWTDQCDADGIADFYGMQSIVARALFEAGECFIRFRPRRVEDGFLVPLQIQLLESDMCPYEKNEKAPNGNYIMNGIELDFLGKRAAYWFYPTHPGDWPVEETISGRDTVRIPASEVLHIFRCTRPGQMRGVPIITPALVRLFLLDSYDDAELERKRLAAMFAAFVTTPDPDRFFAERQELLALQNPDLAPEPHIGLTGLEPGTIQFTDPGEEVKFAEPADVGGSYEAYQYRQQLAIFAALGIPYSLATSDLRRANYSSLRGSIVEYRRKLEQFQHNVIVFQMCAPIWRRWMDTAVLAEALDIDSTIYLADRASYQKAKWIPQRNDWVDPLKDRQAEKLAVDSGFKSRSDVVEAEGSDPEENDKRIAADHAREKELGLKFGPAKAAPPGFPPGAPGNDEDAEESEQQKEDAEEKEDAA